MKDIRILGVDLGKNSCSVVVLDAAGHVLLRRRMRREGVVALAAKLPGCIVAMEACCGAHHLGRLLVARGHEVRLMSPEYVRPYVKAQKNDDRDAEAIAEAATRPTMRFVALKSEAQLDVQVLHRVRDRLVGQRTLLMNQMRSILLERGTVVAQGRRSLLEALAALSEEGGVSCIGSRVRLLLDDMLDQWQALDRRIKALDDEFAEMARRDPAARRDAGIWRAQVSGPALYANTVHALAGVLALDFVRSLLLRALATRWFISDGGSPPCGRRPARHQAAACSASAEAASVHSRPQPRRTAW